MLITEHHLKTVGQPSQENGILVSLIYQFGNAESNVNFSLMSENIRQLLSFIGANLENEITNDEMAKKCCMSKGRFIHLFKRATGVSPHSYLQKLRIERGKSLLISTSLCISEISNMCGYVDALYFSRLFKKCVGYSPKAFREKYNEEI